MEPWRKAGGGGYAPRQTRKCHTRDDAEITGERGKTWEQLTMHAPANTGRHCRSPAAFSSPFPFPPPPWLVGVAGHYQNTGWMRPSRRQVLAPLFLSASLPHSMMPTQQEPTSMYVCFCVPPRFLFTCAHSCLVFRYTFTATLFALRRRTEAQNVFVEHHGRSLAGDCRGPR